jgi:hypothetical protein
MRMMSNSLSPPPAWCRGGGKAEIKEDTNMKVSEGQKNAIIDRLAEKNPGLTFVPLAEFAEGRGVSRNAVAAALKRNPAAKCKVNGQVFVVAERYNAPGSGICELPEGIEF